MRIFLAAAVALAILLESVVFAEGLDPAYYDAPEYAADEVPPETAEPEVEGEGLEFLMYNENGVMAFAVIAAHENYFMHPVLARNQIQGRETISQISKNFDEIAMINASYFMPNGSLIGVTKIDGEIVGADDYYRSAIGLTGDGAVIFGRVRYEGSVIFGGVEREIDEVNWARVDNSLVIYNRYFSASTGTNDFGVEVVVEGGVVTDIFRDRGNTQIPANGYVLSAHGTARDIFRDAQVGDRITIRQRIISEDADFEGVPNVIGAGPRLVKGGRIYVTSAAEKFPNDISKGRAPRAAVGVTKYGDYIFAVVDGRQAHSRGCTLEEWAGILLNNFGAVDAINLDGGGSAELFVKGSLVNRPSDGRERQVASALAIFAK